MTPLLAKILGFAVLIGLSALFAAAETAYTGLAFNQIKRIRKSNPGKLALWESAPQNVLASLFLSNNATHVGVGVLTANMTLELVERHGWPDSVTGVLMGLGCGIVLLLFGEIIPKVFARRMGITFVLAIDGLVSRWSRLVDPFARWAVRITNAMLMGYPRRPQPTPFLQDWELKRILTHTTIPSGSKKILDNVMNFSQSKVKDVMISREEIFAVSCREPMRRIIERVIQSGFSRVPVYDASFDQVIGLLYAKDLLVAWRSGALVVLDDLLRPVHQVAREMALPELLRIFRSGRQHLSIVTKTDGARRVEGLVTLQDALESIVGEIKEEE